MKHKWTQVYQTKWHLVCDYDGVYLTKCCVAVAYQNADGWRGIVCTSPYHADEVLFLQPDNLVDMKLLLETTVALRSSGDGV